MSTSKYLLTDNIRQKNKFYQSGVSLLELMVGMAIGLLVVAAATGALLVSRTVTSSVSDASTLQQQGSYILRVFGQQLRQVGSLYLNPDANGTTPNDVLSSVVFEIKAEKKSISSNDFTLQDILSGDDTTLTTGFRRYADEVYVSSNTIAATIPYDFLMRNCIGLPGSTSLDQRIESIFSFTENQLHCAGNNGNSQPIANNLAELQFRYLIPDTSNNSGASIRYQRGNSITDWTKVQGVQVCFVIYGTDPIDLPAGSSYIDCSGQQVDITTLENPRRNRIHTLFRNTFQLRSQGLPTA